VKRSRLEISDVIEREFVTIFGEPYDLVARDDLSANDIQAIQRRGRRLEELIQAPHELADAEQQELAGLLDSIVRKVLIAPDAIHTRLKDMHRLQIVRVFSTLLQASLLPGGATTAAAGETSFPSSADSTAPIPS
jgi:hypothetical protein